MANAEPEMHTEEEMKPREEALPPDEPEHSGEVKDAAEQQEGEAEVVTEQDTAPEVQDVVHETTPEDVVNFCATQACAEPGDVVNLAESTLRTLGALWDEIGYARHERENSTAEMFSDVKRVFEKKMACTQEAKCAIVSQIRLVRARISTVQAEVGHPPKEGEGEEKGGTLREALAEYKAHLESLEATKAERSSTIEASVKALTSLFLEMEDALTTEQTKFLRVLSDFTTKRIEQISERHSDTVAEKERREGERSDSVGKIEDLWAELEVEDDAKAHNEIDQWLVVGLDIKPSASNLARLSERVEELEALKGERQSASDAHFQALEGLWSRLKVEEEEKARVRREMGGLGLRSLDALAKHIAELTVIKQERMKELVGEVRDSLTEVWDAMRLSDESRRLFQPLFSEVFDDQALQSHEERLSSDKSRLEKMQPLIKMVERREQIRAEETAMIAAQADPNRLLGRGRGAAQALKQEEKVRNMVSKELPKVTERLRAAIVDYEASEGCPFELSGRSVTEALAEEDAAAALAKQESARSRGRSVPASDRPGTASKTPGPNALNQSLNASVSSVSSALRERPASARGAGGVTPGSRLKAAAKSVIAANKGARPASAAPTSENTNPQKGDNLPTSLLQPPSSRLKAPGTTRTVLKFDQETTHVISPRTGLPKRMITPLQAKE